VSQPVGRSFNISVFGKIVYGAIGDKTGPYFGLPNKLFVRISPSCSPPSRNADSLSFQVEDVSPTEMGKVKVGFSVRLINEDLLVGALLSDELNDTTKQSWSSC